MRAVTTSSPAWVNRLGDEGGHGLRALSEDGLLEQVCGGLALGDAGRRLEPVRMGRWDVDKAGEPGAPAPATRNRPCFVGLYY